MYLFFVFDLILYVPVDNFSFIPGLNKYLARINVSCSRTNAVTLVRLEPSTPWSRVKHSTTEPLCFHISGTWDLWPICFAFNAIHSTTEPLCFHISGTWDLWPICFAFNAIPSLCCLILFPFCPESPPYLLSKHDEDGARKGNHLIISVCHVF